VLAMLIYNIIKWRRCQVFFSLKTKKFQIIFIFLLLSPHIDRIGLKSYKNTACGSAEKAPPL